MDRYCQKHPDQKMVELFTSWACDTCDGKIQLKPDDPELVPEHIFLSFYGD
jgi:hypothetical protein